MIFKNPLHYLFWTPPALSAESEISIAELIRLRGIPRMIMLFWGIPFRADRGWLALFLSYNYPGVLLLALSLICVIAIPANELTALLVITSICWFVTLLYGTIRHLGWLIMLLFRWPPVAKS